MQFVINYVEDDGERFSHRADSVTEAANDISDRIYYSFEVTRHGSDVEVHSEVCTANAVCATENDAIALEAAMLEWKKECDAE